MFGKIVNLLKYPFALKANKNFYSKFVGDNKLFFDIGANIGFKTKVFRDIGVKVIAVEPQKDCLKILKNKFSKDSQVVLVDKGISNQKCILKIKISSTSSGIATFSDKWQKEGRFNKYIYDKEQDVNMITMDDLINNYGIPDFCKIDVEGYEYEVISGLTKKIPCISFEFTSEFFDSTVKILNFLNNLGFKEFNFGTGEKMELRLKEWTGLENIIKVISGEIKNNSDLWGDIYAK